MALFPKTSRNGVLLVMATLLSGGLLYLATDLNPFFWTAWIAPIPLLVAAFRTSDRQARLLAVLASLIGTIGFAHYLWLEITPLVAVIVMALTAFCWQFVVGVTRRYVLQSRHLLIVFLFPALRAGLDTLITTVSAHGTAGSFAYSQMDALPVLQIASLTGTAGIVFLVSLFPSLVAIALHRGRDAARPELTYGIPLAVIVAALAFGEIRLMQPLDGPTISVGLEVSDKVTSFSKEEAPALAALTHYGQQVAGLAQDGAQIVVFPEEIAFLTQSSEASAQEILGKAAADSHVYLLAGVNLTNGDHQENRAWFFGPSGHLIADYAKRHLIPGLESPRITPGHSDVAVQIGSHRLGIAICKDMDFSELGRGYSRLGVDAMLVPAWDFDIDNWSHARPAHLRGIEGGYAVFRAARHGLLTVTDRYGRVTAAKSSADADDVKSVTTLALPKGGATFYARFGDWFGWGCALACVLVIISPLARRALRKASE